MFRIKKRRNVPDFNNPAQVKLRDYKIISIFGKLGFFTKALIYAFIGGLTTQSAFTDKVYNDSPQGVFILLGSQPEGASHVYLIAMLTGVVFYAIWRYWEGITGQGYDKTFSGMKNFFKYRLSPIASGAVYTAYGIYIITLFTDRDIAKGSTIRDEDSTCFPICWRQKTAGRIGLAILSIAFTIATITQLIPAFTGNFRDEMDFDKFQKGFGKILKYPFLIAGHIGFAARAILFFLVCFFFWKVLIGDNFTLEERQSSVAQAINNVRSETLGKLIMAILGLGLLMYGLFAALCTYFKIFPTPPPSGNDTLP